MTEAKTRRALLGLGIAFLLGFVLLPFGWMAAVALHRSPDFLLRPGGLTLGNFVDILRQQNLHFPDYLRNSAVVSGIAALVSASLGALAAYAVGRMRPPGRVGLVFGVLALSMFPQVSIVGYLYRAASSLGWLNTYPALVLPYIAWSMPLALWIMLSYFGQIPEELDRAALVDGAGRFQIFFRVVMPLALPGFLATVLLLFMFSFNEFLFALMLTVDYRAQTVPVGIALFQGLHGEVPWGHIMAASCVSCLPVVLIALFLQRYIVQGLAGGAVKG